jgi:hypothetical protein
VENQWISAPRKLLNRCCAMQKPSTRSASFATHDSLFDQVTILIPQPGLRDFKLQMELKENRGGPRPEACERGPLVSESYTEI